MTGLLETVRTIEDLQSEYEKIRLFGSHIETKNESQKYGGKDTLSEIMNLLSIIEGFEPENYHLFERNLLEKTHQEAKEVVNKKS